LSFGASHRSRVQHDYKWCNLAERLVGLPNLRDITHGDGKERL